VAAGEVIAGRFAIEAFERDGAMGAVYRAHDHEVGQPVALELWHPRAGEAERFAHEMRMLAEIRHPAIVRYVARGSEPDGLAFLASAWRDGQTLAQRLERAPLAVAEIIALARSAAAGLAVAHTHAIVHGDMNSGNVFLVDADPGRVTIFGFGVACLRPRRCLAGRSAIGGFIAPELTGGSFDIDARADVYALGCLLFECLIGTSEAAALAGLSGRAAQLSLLRHELPARLLGLVTSMLAEDRDERPADATAVLNELQQLGDLGDGAARVRVLSAATLSGSSSTVGARPAPPAPSRDPPTHLAARYRIDRELGRGAMGRVFAAHDMRLGRDVAVKLSAFPKDPRDAQLFAHEARAVARINHPNIVTVYDIVTTEDGPAIVSELLEGATLRGRLADGPLPVRLVVALGRQLAEGLAAAHASGVVHRDLKPANLFVTRDERLKILDFGVAKLADRDDGASQTREGTVLGTVPYMSPEQVRGRPADARSDLFSAGVVLYEMLAGRRPFEGADGHEVSCRILNDDPPPLPEAVPAALAAIVAQCLEKAPESRFRSASDLSMALARVQAEAKLIVARRALDRSGPLGFWRRIATWLGVASPSHRSMTQGVVHSSRADLSIP
jgi:serine/threonine protein kinase